MKNTIFSLILLTLFPSIAEGQTLTLAECQELSRTNYPLLQQGAIDEAITQLQLEKLDLNKRPQISWKAQATYQTESVEVPFSLPSGEQLSQPKLNGQTTLEANYILYEGGRIEAAKAVEQAQLGVKKQSLEVALEPLKQQVNQLYFGILLAQAQDSILLQTKTDLEVRRTQLEAGVRGGVVLPSEVTKLEVELLRLESKRQELAAGIQRQLATLGYFIGRVIDDQVKLALPDSPTTGIPATVARPELELYQQQKLQLLSQNAVLEAERRPQLSAFIQAGAGYANPLNFFDTNLTPFAVGGLRFQWNIIDWGKKDKDKQLLELQAKRIDTQQATFLHQLDVLDGQYIADENKLQQLLEQGEAIQLLQEELLAQTAAQLEHGVATANDYLIQSTAVTQTKLNQKLYELQQLQLRIDYLTSKGVL